MSKVNDKTRWNVTLHMCIHVDATMPFIVIYLEQFTVYLLQFTFYDVTQSGVQASVALSAECFTISFDMQNIVNYGGCKLYLLIPCKS